MAPLSVFYTSEQIASNIYILSSISNVAVSFLWPLLTSFPADTMLVSPEPRSHIVFQPQANSLSGRVWKSVSAWALPFRKESGWRGGPARGNSLLCVSPAVMLIQSSCRRLGRPGSSCLHLPHPASSYVHTFNNLGISMSIYVL